MVWFIFLCSLLASCNAATSLASPFHMPPKKAVAKAKVLRRPAATSRERPSAQYYEDESDSGVADDEKQSKQLQSGPAAVLTRDRSVRGEVEEQLKVLSVPETFRDRLADCGNISGEWPLSSFVAHAETIATMYECLDQSWEPLRKLHDILLGPGKRRAINKTTLAKETRMDRRQIAPALYLLSNLILHRDRNLRASSVDRRSLGVCRCERGRRPPFASCTKAKSIAVAWGNKFLSSTRHTHSIAE